MIARSALAFAALFAVATPAVAEDYHFDPMHMNLLWQGDHFGFSHPSGKFTKVDGVLKLDEKSPAKSSLHVTVDTTSLETGFPEFNEHLSAKDFLDSKEFPTATFDSTKVVLQKNSDKTYADGPHDADVEGMLTLRGVTKPVTLHVHLNKIGLNPIMKQQTAGFTATASFKRSDFGMNKYLPGVGDEVKIMIECEASPPAAASPTAAKTKS